ncbi:MAG: hypothetical protein LBU32_13920 [Clostridiales bacterium]|jgi:beta-mannosidase|nr:hypothetical protein [Clostridiales bacterium]
MEKISLDGLWRLALCDGTNGAPENDGGLEWMDAIVPGEIHYDLERSGKLRNIFRSKADAEKGMWVSDRDWVYEKDFNLGGKLNSYPGAPPIFLHLDCVDTYSDIYLNGIKIASTDNAFLRQRVLLDRTLLHNGDNTLRVHLKGHRRMVADRADEAAAIISVNDDFARSRSLIRRHQRNWSTDLTGYGVYVLGIGLPRSVCIEEYPSIYIDDFHFQTISASKEKAEISAEVWLSSRNSGLSVLFSLKDERGEIAAQFKAEAKDGFAKWTFSLESPKLWWPNRFMTGPYLYNLEMSVLSGEEAVSSKSARVGVRKTEIVEYEPSGKDTFYIKINQKKIYIRGGNYMPADYLTGTGTQKANGRLLRLARDSGMNMLRLWGGGNNESEAFYSACDEFGLLIWKEQHMHSHTYPDYDKEFIRQTTEDAIATIKYLRNHACFGVICGGNEQQEGWDAWHWRAVMDRFYGERMLYGLYKDLASEHCPNIPYVPNSPHGKYYSQSPVDGDTHTWGNFFNATKDPQFVCETRWFSGASSRMETLEKYMGSEIWTLNYRGWIKRFKELTGQDLIGIHQYSEYHMVDSLKDYLQAMEIEQYLSDYHALYYLRSRSPSLNGFIYWPLNMGGPWMYLGAVDYDGRQLMSYYLLHRLYSDYAIHIYRDANDIRIMGGNASGSVLDSTLEIKHYRGSNIAGEFEAPALIEPCNNKRIFDLDGYYGKIEDRRREVVYAALKDKSGKLLSEDFVFFCQWAEFQNEKSIPKVKLKPVSENKWQIEIVTDVFAKMISIELGYVKAYLSDNYFTALPGRIYTIDMELDSSSAKDASFTVEALDGGKTKPIRLDI